MSQYFLISSRDPYECRETENFYRLAANLTNSGHSVTLLLVQNGVLPVRKSSVNREFASLLRSKVKVEVDEFSARERAITPERIKKGIAITSLETVIDAMEKGVKTIWH